MSPEGGTCARCGSSTVHRSRPRSRAERLLRALTPLTVTRCHACGHRAWALSGSRRNAGADQPGLGLPARPVERRDDEASLRRRTGLVLTVVGAAAVGAAVAFWLFE